MKDVYRGVCAILYQEICNTNSQEMLYIKPLSMRLNENVRIISAKPFPAGQLKQINKEVVALNNILAKYYDALMDLRQLILAKRGLAPHFRATRSNLEKVAIEASHTDVSEQGFVEV